MRITNAWPRVRIAITPSSAANAAPTTPASGTKTNGETSTRIDEQADRVGADAEERALPERDVAAVAGDDVQPHRADREDQRQDDHVLVEQVARDDGEQQQDDARRDDQPASTATLGSDRALIPPPRPPAAARRSGPAGGRAARRRSRRRAPRSPTAARCRSPSATRRARCSSAPTTAPGQAAHAAEHDDPEQARDPLVVRAGQERVEHADDRAAGAGRRRRRSRTSAPPPPRR